MKKTLRSREAMIAGTTWCRWLIFLVASALLFLLFAFLMGPVAFGAVVPGGPGWQAEDDAEEPGEEEPEDPEEEEGEEPEETRDSEEVLEEVLERIDAIFEKCLDALSQAMEEAADEAQEALELAMSNVEAVRDWFVERGLPPFAEKGPGGPFADSPRPGDADGDEGGEEAEDGEEGEPGVETPVSPQPPVKDELPVEPPVPWVVR